MQIDCFNATSMSENTYDSPVLFVIGALAASYAVIYFSKAVTCVKWAPSRAVSRLLIFLGRRSLDIVIWHFVFFRIVIVIQMLLAGEPLSIKGILSYYPVYNSDGFWWIAYLVVGVAVPVLWCSLLRLGPWGKLFKKLHFV